MYDRYARLYDPETHREEVARSVLEDLESSASGSIVDLLSTARRRASEARHTVTAQILADGARTMSDPSGDPGDHEAAIARNRMARQRAMEVHAAAEAYLTDPTASTVDGLGAAIESEREATGEVGIVREWSRLDAAAYPGNQGVVYPPAIEYVRSFAAANLAHLERFRASLEEELSCTPRSGRASRGGVSPERRSPTPPESSPAENRSPDCVESEPDYGDWFAGVNNYTCTVDRRGSDPVRIVVGADVDGHPIGFAPPAVRIEPGTRVRWEWRETDSLHVVDFEGTDVRSSIKSTGRYERTFTRPGIYRYACTPHYALGQRGAVVVRDSTDGE